MKNFEHMMSFDGKNSFGALANYAELGEKELAKIVREISPILEARIRLILSSVPGGRWIENEIYRGGLQQFITSSTLIVSDAGRIESERAVKVVFPGPRAADTILRDVASRLRLDIAIVRRVFPRLTLLALSALCNSIENEQNGSGENEES